VNDGMELAGVHAPRFRGDTKWGLFLGGIWAILLGGWPFLVGFPMPPVMLFAGVCWAWGAWLLWRFWVLRAGIVVWLGPEGFVQYPRTREAPRAEPWRQGVEIDFLQRRKIWRFRIAEGFRRRVDIMLPGQSDADVQSIREKLAQWQTNRVFVETL
jgi:hypothetical protein